MTDRTARTVANVAVASAGIAAAYIVLTTPKLRRAAWGATRLWLGAGLPAYIVSQVRQAWRESAQPTPVVHSPW